MQPDAVTVWQFWTQILPKHSWNDLKQKTHVEPESATDAARSDSSGCATVALRYYKFIDGCHLEAAKLYLGKLGGQLARASQSLDNLECLHESNSECRTVRSFWVLLHTDFYTHTHAFTHRHFYTQTLLHTETFTHRRFYTQTLLHRAHRSF